MQMTPNRKNKHYPSSNNGTGMGLIKVNSNATSCYSAQRSLHNQQQQRCDQAIRNIRGNVLAAAAAEEKYQHQHSPRNSHFQNATQQKPPRKTPHKTNKSDNEFIPLFVLVDASKENNERKVREICRKLMMLEAEEAEPVVNFQDQTGRTALSYVCGSGSINIIEEVSKIRFTDPNLADNDGNAPLHYSSVCGHIDGVDFLLRRFNGVIDVNVRNVSGLTPLMKAALQGRTRCAKRLLAAGASPYLKDHIRGLTAAEWARLCGRHMCEEIINRSIFDTQDSSSTNSSLVYSKTFPSLQEESYRNRTSSEDYSYYHMYARSTVNGAKWLKNKIKKVLGASVRSGEDRSYVCDNPLVKSLADKRPTDRNYSGLTNIGLGGAALCASSLLLPDIQPIVHQQTQRSSKVNRKLSIPTGSEVKQEANQ